MHACLSAWDAYMCINIHTQTQTPIHTPAPRTKRTMVVYDVRVVVLLGKVCDIYSTLAWPTVHVSATVVLPKADPVMLSGKTCTS